MSQKGQGQQPPEALPVHPAIIQKARSVQVHQSWDQETEKQLLSQGHQTAKQQSLTQKAAAYIQTHITGHFNKWITSHFKQCHFNNVNISFITHLIWIYYTLYHLLHLAYVARPSLIHIFICTYSYSIPLDLCVLGTVVVVELLDYLLDITALSELEAQAFRYTHINIC